MAKKIDRTGQRYGRLVAQHRLAGPMWVCKCDCGNETTVHQSGLATGNTRSCGCLRVEASAARAKTHGEGGQRTPTYESWAHMRQRCTNPNARQWEWYGGRGVKFDPRWDSFQQFLEGMGPRPEGTVLDRIDPNKDYTKDNCEWRPLKDSVRRNTPMVQGMSIKAYAQANGLKYHTAYARWKAGTLT